LDAGEPEAIEHVRDALERHGSAAAAAEELGVSAATAGRWAHLVGLVRPRGNPEFLLRNKCNSAQKAADEPNEHVSCEIDEKTEPVVENQ
jgi:hypothetical protein